MTSKRRWLLNDTRDTIGDMSDAYYFICLAVALVCAVAAPWALVVAFHSTDGRPRLCVFAGFAVAAGWACALPFGKTQELPWLPTLATAYFMAVTVSAIFYGLNRIHTS